MYSNVTVKRQHIILVLTIKLVFSVNHLTGIDSQTENDQERVWEAQNNSGQSGPSEKHYYTHITASLRENLYTPVPECQTILCSTATEDDGNRYGDNRNYDTCANQDCRSRWALLSYAVDSESLLVNRVLSALSLTFSSEITNVWFIKAGTHAQNGDRYNTYVFGDDQRLPRVELRMSSK